MKRDTHKEFLDTTYPSPAHWLVPAKEAKQKVRGILSQLPAKNVKVMLQQNFVGRADERLVEYPEYYRV